MRSYSITVVNKTDEIRSYVLNRMMRPIVVTWNPVNHTLLAPPTVSVSHSIWSEYATGIPFDRTYMLLAVSYEFKYVTRGDAYVPFFFQ